MEICAECQKPIGPGQPSYYRRSPTADIGETFHSTCGDPMGLQAVRNDTLEKAAQMLMREYPDNVNTNAFCAAIRSMKSKC